MPPAKWDDESEEETSSDSSEDAQPQVVTSARRKFDDEEDSDEVLDSWDAAEDSEEERKKAAKVAAAKAKAEAEAAANKKTKKERIEEQREARRRRAAEQESDDDEDEDEATRRARAKQSEMDSDLTHAQALFDDVTMGSKKRAVNKATIIDDSSNPGQAIDLSQIALFKPVTKTQFEALSAALVPLLTASSSKPHYSIWVQDFVKKITADLPSTEIKKAASSLTALSNEKLKEEKADKGGKKSKAAKSKTTLSAGRDIGRGVADTTAYDDDLDDGDFM